MPPLAGGMRKAFRSLGFVRKLVFRGKVAVAHNNWRETPYFAMEGINDYSASADG